MLPWISTEHCQFETFRINRAEPGHNEGLRPDTPYVRRVGNAIVCWPTKLTLTPLMADQVIAQLDAPAAPNPGVLQAQTANVAPAPWEQMQ